MILTTTPTSWQDYELIDTGDYEKLERFGKYIVQRPEPQALWSKSLSDKEWTAIADAHFKKDKTSAETGKWILKKHMPEKWQMQYRTPQLQLRFKLALTSFKHVGLFPEQSINWDYIYHQIKSGKFGERPKVLNLFAYTGLASLAANAAGAEVTHLDAVKQVVTWARENMELSGLRDIRWIVEDAFTFVKREINRGNKYQGIILDPPAYGRGPKGEKWLLTEQINDLLRMVRQLLDPAGSFLVANLYSLNFSALILDNLMRQHFEPLSNSYECGEIYIADRFHKKLPLGIYARF